jgi:hypothetical protein
VELGSAHRQITHDDIVINSVLTPQRFGIEKLDEAVCVSRSAAKSRSIEVFRKSSTSKGICKHLETQRTSPHSLGAPALYDACEHHLFGVVGNEGNQIINDTPEMTVWTFANNRSCQTWK